MRDDAPRARLEGLGETALAAMEDVEAQLRQLGAPEIEPGFWRMTERYFRTIRATPAMILFEVDVGYVWVNEAAEDEGPF